MVGFKLTNEIINISESTVWDLAKLEWSLAEVYEADKPERCLCGHFPILEVCILTNQKNGNRTEVGNCCVKKFIGLRSDKIFQAVKRIRKDDKKALNVEAVTHAHQKDWINEWEYNFSISTMRKINLSDKQLDTRRKINAKMLANMKRQST